MCRPSANLKAANVPSAGSIHIKTIVLTANAEPVATCVRVARSDALRHDGCQAETCDADRCHTLAHPDRDNRSRAGRLHHDPIGIKGHTAVGALARRRCAFLEENAQIQLQAEIAGGAIPLTEQEATDCAAGTFNPRLFALPWTFYERKVWPS